MYPKILTILFLNSLTICSSQFFNNISIHIEKNDEIYELINPDSVPKEENITRIRIEDQKLEILKRGTFVNSTHLKSISLRNCTLKKIENGSLRDLPALRILKIELNNLKKLENGNLEHLDITKLSLFGNGIEILGEEVFNTLKYLEELDLSNNHLRNLPMNLLRGTISLQRINLSNNKIESIPPKFFREAFLKRVEGENTEINLGSNRITCLDSLTFDGVKYVKNLIISDNLLDHLHKNIFKDIRKMDILNLEVNYLEYLGEEICKPKELYLYDNNFSSKAIEKIKKWCETTGTHVYFQDLATEE